MDTSHMYYPVSTCVPSVPQVTYKQPVKAQARTRANRRHVTLVAMPSPPRQQVDEQICSHGLGSIVERFQSPRVLEQVVQVEKKHQILLQQQGPPMTPERAIDKLRQVVSLVIHNGNGTTFDALGAQEMLAGLESACWKLFTSDQDGSVENGIQRDHLDQKWKCSNGVLLDDNCQSNRQPRILFSQLLRGTKEILGQEEAACQDLRDQIRRVEERNNELPRLILERQTDIARATKVAGHGIQSLERKLSSTSNIADETNVAAGIATIREELAEMKRRRELRSWACNELHVNVNDLITRRSELKQLITTATEDVTREKQANKQQAKQLEELQSLSIGSLLLPTDCRVESKTPAQQQLVRLTMALAKHQTLQNLQKDRKAFVRARIEAIFGVRNEIHELNNQRLSMEKDRKDLEEAIPCLEQKEVEIEEDCACEQRMMQILASNWSTVAKVGAIATDLVNIQMLEHAGDAVSAEQEKLRHLCKEITLLMQQLEAVKALCAA